MFWPLHTEVELGDGVNLSAALHQLALKSRRAGTATSACGALVSDPRFAQLMNSLLQVLPSLEAQNLARTAWAFAKLSVADRERSPMVTELARQVPRCTAQFQPH